MAQAIPSPASSSTTGIPSSAASRTGIDRAEAAARASSRPAGDASPERLELEQLNARIPGGRHPRLLRVVAPRRQVEPDVVEVGMRGDVSQRLDAILDEPEAGTPSFGREAANQRAQVVALVVARL